MAEKIQEKQESGSNAILIWLIAAYVLITGGMLLLTNDPSTKQTVIGSILWLSGVLVANINKIIENATNVEIERQKKIIQKKDEEMLLEKERAKKDMEAKQMEVTGLTEKFEEEMASANEAAASQQNAMAKKEELPDSYGMPSPCAPGNAPCSMDTIDNPAPIEHEAWKKSAFNELPESTRSLEGLQKSFESQYRLDRLIEYRDGGFMRLTPSHTSKSYIAYKNENNRNVIHLWENEINFSISAFSLDANEIRELVEKSGGEAFPKNGAPLVVRFKFGKGGWEKYGREIQQFIRNGAEYLSRKATKNA